MRGIQTIRHGITAIFCLIAVILCAFLPSFVSADGKEGSSLTVGVPTDRCPVFYKDAKTGEITGIGVDLMLAAAEEAGMSVTFQEIGEATLKEALDCEDYDLVMPFGSALKSAAGLGSVVSENLIQTPFTLVTKAGTVQEKLQLNELRVGMLSSLAAGAETVRGLYPGIEITLYDSMPESVKALRKGEVDALLHNSYVWSYVLQKPSYRDLTVQPSAMFSMDFRAGTLDTPEGREIIGRLNEGIEKLPDTRRQAIILDYTTRQLYEYDFGDYIYLYGFALLFFVLFLVALIVIAVMHMRAIRMRQEEELRRLMDYDQLTGVLSLQGFRKRVEELLHANLGIQYFLSYINIKNFKYINYSLGMNAGDQLLRFFAQQTREHLSEKEAVCRINADRFAVLSRAEGEDGLRSGQQEVLDTVRHFFTDRGKENRVLLCGGIYVLTPEDYRNVNVDRMLDYARLAEKKVRVIQNDGYAFYNPEQWERGRRTADVINRLPLAIENGELQVWYQPQVDYAAGKITGAEALCRWDHDKLGWLQPADFITTLEESGLIYDLDLFVWDRVCQDLCRWKELGYHRKASVNVSRVDFREDRDIPEHFHQLIGKYGLTPDQLRIEITETAYVERPELLIGATEKLQSYGFQVEMDDFGSGNSSLHMLKDVPVDRIKLDLHFLRGSRDTERSRIIISCMIQMMNMLGLDMIAEGVETNEQAQFLESRGCTMMQGYYFHKPMPVAEYEKLCEENEAGGEGWERESDR